MCSLSDERFYWFGLGLKISKSVFEVGLLVDFFFNVEFAGDDNCDFRQSYVEL